MAIETDPLVMSVYPWDEWTNGKTWLISHGDDYKVTTPVMQRYLYTVAQRRGLTVDTQRVDDTIKFQFSTNHSREGK